MDRNSNYRDRDEYGRFTSDDDDYRGGSRSRGGNRSMPERDSQGRFMRDDDDDYRYGSRSRGGYRSSGPERDSQGRYMSDDDRDNRSRSASRHGDDDRRSLRYDDSDGRGWYGDSQGHSEAARMGWEHRGGGDHDYGRSGYSRSASSRYSDDDDYRSGSRSRGRDDDYGRDRGQGGWFGDSEGHSEAARMGWEHRGGGNRSQASSRYSDDDDRRSSYGSRSRDHDEGYGRDRGQGGWFGDSEGHAEAARRGWRNR